MKISVKIFLASLFFSLMGCAGGKDYDRDYVYEGGQFDSKNKAILIARVYNKTSYGIVNASLPNLLHKLTNPDQSFDTEIIIGARLYISNGVVSYILGDPEKLKDKVSGYFDLFYKISTDKEKQFMYNPNYDIVILEPGNYKVNDYEFTGFYYDRVFFSKNQYRGKMLSFNVKPGEVLYIGDIEIMAKTGEIKIHNSFHNAQEFLDKNYPKISSKLKYRKLS